MSRRLLRRGGRPQGAPASRWRLGAFLRSVGPEDAPGIGAGWRSVRSSRLARATAGTVFAAGVGQLFLLVSGPLVARLLGVDDRGHFAWLTAWAGIVIIVGHFGTSVACGYFVSRHPAQTRHIFRTAAFLYVLQSIGLTLLLWVLLGFVASDDPQVQDAIPATLALVPAALMHLYAMSFLQGQQRFLAFNLVRLGPPAMYAAAVTVLFVADVDRLDVVVGLWTLTHAVAAIVGALLVIVGLPQEDERAPGLLRRITGFAARGWLGTTSPLDLPVDQILIGAFVSPAALGLWVVGAAFRNLPSFIGQSVGMVAYPAAAAVEDARDAWRLVWRFLGGLTVLMVPLTLTLIAVMPQLVELFFGAQFAGAASIARLLVLGALFASLRRVLLDGLRGTGHPGRATLAELAMYPWLVVGGPLLLWAFGADGLAAAVAGGYAICFAVALASGIELTRRADEGRVSRAIGSPASEPR